MTVDDFFTFLFIISAIISAVLLQLKLLKSISGFPAAWKNNSSVKRFRSGISFLLIFLVLVFLSESISRILAFNGIYNSFIFSFYFTLSTPFLFGYLFIYTKTKWKRVVYYLLYLVLTGYLVRGGYYHPHCVLPSDSSLLIFSIYFIALFLQLTDLLLAPKSDQFNFQLKINLTFLIYSLIASILTSFHWEGMIYNVSSYELFFRLHLVNIMLVYFFLSLIFITERIKLRHG